jgi:UDP-N-acetylmuramoyl-tripeptide--D-alanyl-D-alanine ligase
VTARELLMDFDQLSGAAGGRLISFNSGIRGFSSVSVDSRSLAPGALFVALPGSVEDGHAYVGSAFKAGASAAMVAESRMSPALEEAARNARAALVVVEDTLKSLQDTARVYLEGFPSLLKISITGSSGKTTTKELAAAMIGREKSVVFNPGNLNSEIGLPLAVFAVRSHHEVGIFEMGMNRKGEIAELAGVLKPHIAIIITVGSGHIGIIGSMGGIAQEKKAVFSEFTGTELALIPEDEPYGDFLAQGVRGRVCRFSTRGCPELGEVRDRGLKGWEFTWEGELVHFGLPGRYNLKNALAAAAIARAVPVGARAIREGLEAAAPLFGRSEILPGPVTVFRDCYNANPESTAEAITFCDGLEWPGRRVYIIGSMLELGDSSRSAHEELGRRLALSKADMICLYGAETAAAAAVLEQPPGEGRKIPFFHTDIMGELSRAAEEYIRPGDLVLLKGSRNCALEGLTDIIRSAGNRAERGAV